MKRIPLFVCFTLLAMGAWAQTSAVNKADVFRRSGDLSKAKENIDESIVHEETFDKGRTWYVYGQIHEDIFNSEDSDIRNLAEDPVAKASKGYRKAMELESNYYTRSSFAIENLWGELINKGALASGEGNYEVAYTWFSKAQEAKPEDTDAYLYGGWAAERLERPEDVLTNFRKLVGLGYKDIKVYYSIIYYTLEHEKDTTGALDWTANAREIFPDDAKLRQEEVNLLIQTGQIEDAKNGLEDAIAKEPNNPNLLYTLGFLYERLGNEEKTVENYKKAIEADPQYFDAVYNLAAFYYNQAANLITAANDLPIREYEAKGKALEKEARKNLVLSLPYMEQASKIRPEEPTIWYSLYNTYTLLKVNNKANEAYEKYDSLTSGGE